MSNIQMALQQTRWAGGAAAPAPVAAVAAAPAPVVTAGFSPPTADASGATGGLEAIQKRIRDLSMGGGAA